MATSSHEGPDEISKRVSRSLVHNLKPEHFGVPGALFGRTSTSTSYGSDYHVKFDARTFRRAVVFCSDFRSCELGARALVHTTQIQNQHLTSALDDAQIMRLGTDSELPHDMRYTHPFSYPRRCRYARGSDRSSSKRACSFIPYSYRTTRASIDVPNHAKVLQQLGWLYHLPQASFQNQDLAVQYLTKSLEADASDAQSWYLLGRAYMAGQKYSKAYDAYQQAVYRDGRNPTFWC
ncbi:hypothetical protein EXIGLDRAFT_776268, partial [Exidia glandulosa HHB12029]